MRTSRIGANVAMPRIAQVAPVGETSVEVTWSAGSRANRTEKIDLAPLLYSKRIFRPLRNNPLLFATVNVISRGNAIAWADNSDLEMSAKSLEQLAKETFTAAELQQFLREQGLTHEAFAALISYSRRQVENFLSGSQPVPRVVTLACFGLAQRGARSQSPQLVQIDDHAAKSVDAFVFQALQRSHAYEFQRIRVAVVDHAAPELQYPCVPRSTLAASMIVQSFSSPPQVASARAVYAATTMRPAKTVRHVKVS